MRRWLIIVLAFTGIGLVESTQVYYLQKDAASLPFWRVLLWQAGPWYLWVPVTPGIIWLGRTCPLKRGVWLRNLPIHLLLLVSIAIPHFALSVGLGMAVGYPYYFKEPFLDILVFMLKRHGHMDVLAYAAVFSIGNALDFRDKLREKELQAAQLETKLVEAQLQALKMQLHPHFLFNTLHAIGVLIRKQDAARSVKMLTELSDLLRLTLETAGHQKVPLDQELVFVDRYLGIERTRFRDRLTIDTDIPAETRTVMVPNLILQPLVENAIRHGIAPRAEGGTLELVARRAASRLRLQVRDDGVGLPDGWSFEEATGVGLSNVRARLEQLYPADHEFTVEPRHGGGTVVTIDIPLELAEEDEDE